MPNWCYNNVTFEGEENNLENLNKLFEKTIDIQNKTGQGQLLFGLEESIDGYMFDIQIQDMYPGYLNVSFESRWAPIPNDIVRIAELFNLQFEYDYEEGGMNLYGKYTFKYEEEEGVLYEQSASEEDINSCRYKEEDDEDDPEDMSGLNLEKLESIIEHNEMHCRSIERLQQTALQFLG